MIVFRQKNFNLGKYLVGVFESQAMGGRYGGE